MTLPAADPKTEVDSAYAWVRLGISMLISTVGGVGMWSFVVALPTVQADFGVMRGGYIVRLHAADARLCRRFGSRRPIR